MGLPVSECTVPWAGLYQCCWHISVS